MSIIKHVTLQKIVAHDFRYDPRIINNTCLFVLLHVSVHYFTPSLNGLGSIESTATNSKMYATQRLSLVQNTHFAVQPGNPTARISYRSFIFFLYMAQICAACQRTLGLRGSRNHR